MRFLSILFIGLFLGACAKDPPPPAVIEIPKSEIFHPPAPKPLQLIEIQPWQVLAKGAVLPDTMYAVTPRDYETLSYNQAEMRRFISDLLTLMKYYRNLPSNVKPKIEETPIITP